MKCALVALLIAFNSIGALAQKTNLFADAGIALSRFIPGASLTYNYNPVKVVGAGIGIQGYDFHATMPTFQFIPTIFGELRFNIRPEKSHNFFVFFDYGVNLYQHSNDHWTDGNLVYAVKSDNGAYTGGGIAYGWRARSFDSRYFDENDVRFYVSLKMISNGYSADAYNSVSHEENTTRMGDATFVTSFGVKF